MRTLAGIGFVLLICGFPWLVLPVMVVLAGGSWAAMTAPVLAVLVVVGLW